VSETNLDRCVAIVAGVAAALLTRLVLVVATAPHSVVLFSLLASWHWLIAVPIGLCLTVACLFRSRRPGILTAGFLLVASTASLWLVFNVPAMNHLYPGFWIK
jgi:hypothetical protein